LVKEVRHASVSMLSWPMIQLMKNVYSDSDRNNRNVVDDFDDSAFDFHRHPRRKAVDKPVVMEEEGLLISDMEFFFDVKLSLEDNNNDGDLLNAFVTENVIDRLSQSIDVCM